MLCLQVSHHPPVSALHATDDKENIEMTWCHSPISKFNGKILQHIYMVCHKIKFNLSFIW